MMDPEPSSTQLDPPVPRISLPSSSSTLSTSALAPATHHPLSPDALEEDEDVQPFSFTTSALPVSKGRSRPISSSFSVHQSVERSEVGSGEQEDETEGRENGWKTGGKQEGSEAEGESGGDVTPNSTSKFKGAILPPASIDVETPSLVQHPDLEGTNERTITKPKARIQSYFDIRKPSTASTSTSTSTSTSSSNHSNADTGLLSPDIQIESNKSRTVSGSSFVSADSDATQNTVKASKTSGLKRVSLPPGSVAIPSALSSIPSPPLSLPNSPPLTDVSLPLSTNFLEVPDHAQSLSRQGSQSSSLRSVSEGALSRNGSATSLATARFRLDHDVGDTVGAASMSSSSHSAGASSSKGTDERRTVSLSPNLGDTSTTEGRRSSRERPALFSEETERARPSRFINTTPARHDSSETSSIFNERGTGKSLVDIPVNLRRAPHELPSMRDLDAELTRVIESLPPHAIQALDSNGDLEGRSSASSGHSHALSLHLLRRLSSDLAALRISHSILERANESQIKALRGLLTSDRGRSSIGGSNSEITEGEVNRLLVRAAADAKDTVGAGPDGHGDELGLLSDGRMTLGRSILSTQERDTKRWKVVLELPCSRTGLGIGETGSDVWSTSDAASLSGAGVDTETDENDEDYSADAQRSLARSKRRNDDDQISIDLDEAMSQNNFGFDASDKHPLSRASATSGRDLSASLPSTESADATTSKENLQTSTTYRKAHKARQPSLPSRFFAGLVAISGSNPTSTASSSVSSSPNHLGLPPAPTSPGRSSAHSVSSHNSHEQDTLSTSGTKPRSDSIISETSSVVSGVGALGERTAARSTWSWTWRQGRSTLGPAETDDEDGRETDREVGRANDAVVESSVLTVKGDAVEEDQPPSQTGSRFFSAFSGRRRGAKPGPANLSSEPAQSETNSTLSAAAASSSDQSPETSSMLSPDQEGGSLTPSSPVSSFSASKVSSAVSALMSKNRSSTETSVLTTTATAEPSLSNPATSPMNRDDSISERISQTTSSLTSSSSSDLQLEGERNNEVVAEDAQVDVTHKLEVAPHASAPLDDESNEEGDTGNVTIRAKDATVAKALLSQSSDRGETADGSWVPHSPPPTKGYFSSARGTLGRALGVASEGLRPQATAASTAAKSSKKTRSEPTLTLPTFGLGRYSPFAPPPVTSSSAATPTFTHHAPSKVSVSAPAATAPAGSGSVELDAIVAPSAKPPTLSLQNPFSHSNPGSDTDPLVDRFGFLYDVKTGMKLLKEARRRQTGGPAVNDLEHESFPDNSGKEDSHQALARSASADSASNTPSGPQSMKRLLAQLTEMHEAREKTQVEAWDTFLKRRKVALSRNPRDQQGMAKRDKPTSSATALANAGAEMLGVRNLDQDDSSFWDDNLVGVARMRTDTKAGKQDWKDFKRLVRTGIPIAYRPKIWAECSGATEIKEPGYYQGLLSKHEGMQSLCLTQIDMDCHRTFPTNVFFGGDGPGIEKLRRVLVAYSWHNPSVGYCQGMNMLVATLLLTVPTEEDAFWILVCIIEQILPSDFYTARLLVSQADQRVLQDLASKLLPDIHAHLEDLGVDLPAVTFGWFLSLFTDSLPIQTLLRVWDVFIIDGAIVLFRVALAILQINAKEILACDSAANLYITLRTMTTHLYQVDKLVRVAFEEFRSSVKSRDIASLRNKHVADLEKEMSGLMPFGEA